MSEISPSDTPEPRLVEVVHAITYAFATVIREQAITEAEWYAILDFLRDVGRADEVVLLSDVLRLSVIVNQQEHADDGSSPTNVRGPYWREAPAVDNPATLVGPDEPGQHMVLTGRVTGVGGHPLAGAAIDVWQCDANGLYDMQRPELNGEPHLRGVLRTDTDGRYQVTTIIPPPYEVKKDGPIGLMLEALGRHAFRPAHIHLKVSAAGHRTLMTQAFIAGDPWFGRDTIGADLADCVIDFDRSGELPTATFDLKLAPAR